MRDEPLSDLLSRSPASRHDFHIYLSDILEFIRKEGSVPEILFNRLIHLSDESLTSGTTRWIDCLLTHIDVMADEEQRKSILRWCARSLDKISRLQQGEAIVDYLARMRDRSSEYTETMKVLTESSYSVLALRSLLFGWEVFGYDKDPLAKQLAVNMSMVINRRLGELRGK